jgi:hypothetical protein
MRHSPPPSRESGQAAVEAALVVPMMVFLVLGIIQLTMMHHARLMTEYAAYRAARAGIVNHGHCEIMGDAALVALLPTLGPPKSGGTPGRTDTPAHAIGLYNMYKGLKFLNLNHAPGLPYLRLEVLNPRRSQLNSLFSSYGIKNQEIDFDDVRNDTVIAANLLTVRLTYHYEMRVPFANRFIHAWWIGYQYLNSLSLLSDGIQFDNRRIAGQHETDALEAQALLSGGDTAKIAGLALAAKTYVIPVVATYSMRMQSNLIKKHVSKCAK